ncbi:hypothetical protein HDU98_008021 [Podochytrium sp. JEL0797]|nr:hypothetical protein HDU98_008021 [Podochytrium sp. JEL0797]
MVGQVKESLVQTVKELDANVLILGSRFGKSLGTRGSVGKYCVKHCHCPMAVLRPTEDRLRMK